MLNKIKIALSALLVVGFASAAMANGTTESAVSDNWIGASSYQSTNAAASAYASANNQHSVKPYTAVEKARFDRETATHGQY